MEGVEAEGGEAGDEVVDNRTGVVSDGGRGRGACVGPTMDVERITLGKRSYREMGDI